MGTVIFEETQHFRQWWVWLISLVSLAFPVVIITVVRPGENADGATHAIPLVFSILIPLFIILLLYFMRLTTRITTTGISYRFFPIHGKFREIPFSGIGEIYVRSYEPLYEYGGWGIRYTIRNGKAYNIAGNKGIQLELKNGKKILIGTQKADEVTKALEEVKGK